MRAARLLLAAALAALSWVVLTAAPSFACSCAMAGTDEHVDNADVVIAGTAVDHEPPPQRPVMSSGDPVTYTFAVERVFKGQVGETVEVSSASSGASCGLEGIEQGERYVVLATQEGDGALWASLCGGTARWSADFEAAVVEAAGPGTAPPSVAPAGAPGDGTEGPGTGTALDRPTGAGPEEAEGGFLAVPVALASGFGLVLLAGLLWLRLLLRR